MPDNTPARPTAGSSPFNTPHLYFRPPENWASMTEAEKDDWAANTLATVLHQSDDDAGADVDDTE